MNFPLSRCRNLAKIWLSPQKKIGFFTFSDWGLIFEKKSLGSNVCSTQMPRTLWIRIFEFRLCFRIIWLLNFFQNFERSKLSPWWSNIAELSFCEFSWRVPSIWDHTRFCEFSNIGVAKIRIFYPPFRTGFRKNDLNKKDARDNSKTLVDFWFLIFFLVFELFDFENFEWPKLSSWWSDFYKSNFLNSPGSCLQLETKFDSIGGRSPERHLFEIRIGLSTKRSKRKRCPQEF